MIVDVPEAAEFFDSGVRFLNLSWGATIDLLLDLRQSNVDGMDDGEGVTDEYWSRAQRPLSTAITLAQQGAEFLLKARIAKVSPFLLLAGLPREWPRGCDRTDCSYGDFRTIDAQDLGRVHDAVAEQRLSAEFKTSFEEMRRIRNSLMHTVSKSHRFSARDALRWILHIRLELASSLSWAANRLHYLESAAPGGAFPHSHDYGGHPLVIAHEIRAAIDVLSPAESKRLLGVDKEQRFYFCTRCYYYKFGFESHPKTAQLRPNTGDSTNLFCHACVKDLAVRREQCPSCPGNVLEAEEGYCLSCGANDSP